MPMVYMKKDLYDDLVRLGKNPAKFVNELIAKTLKEMKKNV